MPHRATAEGQALLVVRPLRDDVRPPLSVGGQLRRPGCALKGREGDGGAGNHRLFVLHLLLVSCLLPLAVYATYRYERFECEYVCSPWHVYMGCMAAFHICWVVFMLVAQLYQVCVGVDDEDDDVAGGALDDDQRAPERVPLQALPVERRQDALALRVRSMSMDHGERGAADAAAA